MTILYTCRTEGDYLRITKLDDDLNVESSYAVTEAGCECPAFMRRQVCRHLEMLPKFLARETVNTGWGYDYDRGGWVRIADDLEAEGEPQSRAEGEHSVPVGESSGNGLPEASPLEPHSTAVSASDFDSEDGGSNPPEVAITDLYPSPGLVRPLPPAHYPSWRRI